LARLTISAGGDVSAAGKLASNTYVKGSDLSIQAVSGGQSVITSWYGLQLVGNKQSTVEYSPSNIGAAGAYGVIIPAQQTNAVSLGVRGIIAQTANLQNWESSSGAVLMAVDANGNIVFNSTQTVDGRDVSVDGSKLDGIAVGATNTPLASTMPADVTKSASVVGVANTAARADHKHDISTAIVSSIGTTNTEGSSTSLARADHVHAGLTRGANDFSTFTEKTSLSDADLILIEDSAAAGVKKKVQSVNLKGAPLAVCQKRRTTTLNMPTSWNNIRFDTVDVETNPSVIVHDSSNSDRINIVETGTYMVMYQFEVQPTSTGKFEGRVLKNNSTVISGSTQGSITYTNESDIISISAVAALSAGDYVTVQNQIATSGTMQANATFTVLRMNGQKGDTGSGSTITVYDEGVPVTSTPHSTLNFVGDGVTATNAGSGVATITIPGTVFGTQWQQITASTTMTTTSTSWTTYLILATSIIPAGIYRIGFRYNWYYTSITTNYLGRLFLDNTTEIYFHREEPEDAATTQRMNESGFVYVKFDSEATHTIAMQFASGSAGTTAATTSCDLEIWRVS